MQKGQAIIEFVFLILIIVVYLVSVTMPMVKDTQNIIQDTENVTRANNECQKITNSIKEINLFGEGSKQNLILFVPNNTNINCDNTNGISFETQLTQTPFPRECENGICTKNFATSTLLDCNVKQIRGPQKITVTIQKTSGFVAFLRSE